MTRIQGARLVLVLDVGHAEELFPLKPQVVAACARKLREFGPVIVSLEADGTCFTVFTAHNGLDVARRLRGAA